MCPVPRFEDIEAAHQPRRRWKLQARAPGLKRSKPLPDDLPRQTVVHEPETIYGCCGRSRLARLREDVTEVLEKIPARLKV